MVEARRRAGGELRARRDGAARPRRRGDAQGQPAARLRAELGLRPGRASIATIPRWTSPCRRCPASWTSRASRNASPSRPARRCATSSPACISTAASSPRCSTASAPGAGAPSRSRCSIRSMRRSPRTLGLRFGVGWKDAGAHRQPPRRARGVALQRLPDQRRLHRDHLRRRAALEEPARRHGPRRAWRRPALRQPEDARRPHGRDRRARRAASPGSTTSRTCSRC